MDASPGRDGFEAPRGPDAPDRWKARAVPAALLLLAALLLQGLAFIAESSQTSDEAGHLLAGTTYLRTGNFRMYPGEPPLMKELAALPLLLLDLDFPVAREGERPAAFKLGRIFVHENRVPNDTILFLARLPMLLLSLLLGWAIFGWGRRLFGARGALLALALYVFDPNIVAHSCLVMTDLGATLFIFLALYALWCWSERPSPRTLLLAGLASGCAFASKFTAIWLLPILLVVAAGLLFTRRSSSGAPPLSGRIATLALAAAGLAAVAFLVVAITYAGRGLPAYVDGLRLGLLHTTTGNTSYLMGSQSESGWWYYFLVAYGIKTPIGTLVILALAIVAALGGVRRLPRKDEIFLWAPIVLIFLITAVWRVNIGLRHLLPVYPFLCLTAGRIAALPARIAARPARLAGRSTGHPGRFGRLLSRGRLLGGTVLACVAWNVVEAASIAPYDLAYFNELVGGPKNGHLCLLDSNLDWGQASKTLRRYMTAENLPVVYCSFFTNSDPWYYGVRYQYLPGIGNPEPSRGRPDRIPDGLPREALAVSAMTLHFVHLDDGTLYDWLKDRPVVAMPGYAYLVYDITGDAGAHARLASLYLESSLPEPAALEAGRALRLDPDNARARAVLERLGPR